MPAALAATSTKSSSGNSTTSAVDSSARSLRHAGIFSRSLTRIIIGRGLSSNAAAAIKIFCAPVTPLIRNSPRRENLSAAADMLASRSASVKILCMEIFTSRRLYQTFRRQKKTRPALGTSYQDCKITRLQDCKWFYSRSLNLAISRSQN